MPAVALRIMQPSGQACYILDRCSTGNLCSTPHPPFAPSTAGSICAMILIRLSPTTRFKQRQVKNAFCVSGQAVETHSLEPTPDWTGETEHRLPIWILHHPEEWVMSAVGDIISFKSPSMSLILGQAAVIKATSATEGMAI